MSSKDQPGNRANGTGGKVIIPARQALTNQSVSEDTDSYTVSQTSKENRSVQNDSNRSS